MGDLVGQSAGSEAGGDGIEHTAYGFSMTVDKDVARMEGLMSTWLGDLNRNVLVSTISRVPTAQGKQGKWQNKFPGRENTGNLEILPKHREFGLLKL